MALSLDIQLTGNDEAAAAASRLSDRLRRSPRTVLEAIGRDWASRVFPANAKRGDLAPLAPATVRIRGATGPILDRGHGYPQSAKILESGGGEVVVGIRGGKAALLEFGGTTSPNSAFPNRRVPARPIVILDDGEVDRAAERIAGHYFDGVW